MASGMLARRGGTLAGSVGLFEQVVVVVVVEARGLSAVVVAVARGPAVVLAGILSVSVAVPAV